MRKLVLRKKTGFRNLDPYNPVTIRDFRGKLFYTTEPILPVHKFNLPPGSYYVDTGRFRKMNNPVRYKLAKLPPRQRWLKPPYNYNVKFGNNPNKATIYWGKNLILYDKSLKEASLPELWFILFHEFAHGCFKDEHLADLMSTNLMKKRGFNPSQIGTAPITSLSNHQFPRKKFIVDQISQLQ